MWLYGAVKHRMSKTRIYKILYKMKDRCYNKKANNYENYGGRGIKICDEWNRVDGFMDFFKWSMDNGYSKELSIDRIDVDGNYEPSNCKWATRSEQDNNKTNSRFITINGETKTIRQWSDVSGLSFKVIQYRVNSGWEGIRILSEIEESRKRL